ncbi:hypothetical protein [Haloprofundus marisrubri]|nr:hypothetical protein [Haloprofundus marisrubri]
MTGEQSFGMMPTNVAGRPHLWFGIIDEDDEPSKTEWIQSSIWRDVLASR